MADLEMAGRMSGAAQAIATVRDQAAINQQQQQRFDDMRYQIALGQIQRKQGNEDRLAAMNLQLAISDPFKAAMFKNRTGVGPDGQVWVNPPTMKEQVEFATQTARDAQQAAAAFAATQHGTSPEFAALPSDPRPETFAPVQPQAFVGPPSPGPYMEPSTPYPARVPDAPSAVQKALGAGPGESGPPAPAGTYGYDESALQQASRERVGAKETLRKTEYALALEREGAQARKLAPSQNRPTEGYSREIEAVRERLPGDKARLAEIERRQMIARGKLPQGERKALTPMQPQPGTLPAGAPPEQVPSEQETAVATVQRGLEEMGATPEVSKSVANVVAQGNGMATADRAVFGLVLAKVFGADPNGEWFEAYTTPELYERRKRAIVAGLERQAQRREKMERLEERGMELALASEFQKLVPESNTNEIRATAAQVAEQLQPFLDAVMERGDVDRTDLHDREDAAAFEGAINGILDSGAYMYDTPALAAAILGMVAPDIAQAKQLPVGKRGALQAFGRWGNRMTGGLFGLMSERQDPEAAETLDRILRKLKGLAMKRPEGELAGKRQREEKAEGTIKKAAGE
jgi:hypothetical protein